MTTRAVPLKIAFCGEVNSGKSTVLQSILRSAFLPDFFAVENRPSIRVILGAPENKRLYRSPDGILHDIDDFRQMETFDDVTEIVVSFIDTYNLGRPCELVEITPLRDGHVTDAQIEQLQGCDIMVWTTIGSQAWRLSEKTILDTHDPNLPKRRVLVVTRADKFRSEQDRDKLMLRLETETTDYFDAIHMLGVSADLYATPQTNTIWSKAGATDLVRDLATRLKSLIPAQQTASISNDADAPKGRTRSNVQTTAIIPEEDGTVQESSGTTLIENAQAFDAAGENDDSTDPVAEIIASTKGIICLGAVDCQNPDAQNRFHDDNDLFDGFAQLCSTFVKAVSSLTVCHPTGGDPEDLQLITDKHTIFLRVEGSIIFFVVGHASQLNAGIARARISRLIDLYPAPILIVRQAA